ncbi:hypothetical protein ALC62_06029 [Cyphomyrmex costatus]|uniref:Uncharacterized protein n=1 Tax=Cyphomyrmex costatus TaxID=456900 RepID=A0A195CRP2_9HYME|nr:hypothetical protein ALC62_06029 [Cyphomyrmex costatus]
MIFATSSLVYVRYVSICLSGGSHTLLLINENGIGESSGGYAVHLVKSMLSFSNLVLSLPIRNPSLSSVFAKPILDPIPLVPYFCSRLYSIFPKYHISDNILHLKHPLLSSNGLFQFHQRMDYMTSLLYLTLLSLKCIHTYSILFLSNQQCLCTHSNSSCTRFRSGMTTANDNHIKFDFIHTFHAAGTTSKAIQLVHLMISFTINPCLSNSTMLPLESTIPMCKLSRVTL